MNTFKKNGGFTLVELIIVIAILAILSAVAVAGYATYINKANDSAAESFMENVESHVVLANAMAGEVGDITFSAATKGKITVTVADAAPGFAEDFDDNLKAALGVTVTIDESTGDASFQIDAPAAWNNSSYENGASKNEEGKWVGAASAAPAPDASQG